VTIHIAAAPGQIADTVLLPGDPLRARWIAETYLADVECYSQLRNMLGYTGTYRGRRVSVQGSGMGQPSLAIYVHELMREYGVRTVVRVGSCGALRSEVAVRDVVIAMTASTDSAMNRLRFHGIDYAPCADYGLLRRSVELAEARSLAVHVGGVAATDSFYNDRPELLMSLADYGVLGVEMETSALYTIAAKYRARALTICQVSDHLVTGEATSADERESGFGDMAALALDTVAY
jgi:purine-nucleoside phosphorylase